MKNSQSIKSRQGKQGLSHKPVPEIRDNLDSRMNEEQDFKGSDNTHNHKDQHSQRKTKKK